MLAVVCAVLTVCEGLSSGMSVCVCLTSLSFVSASIADGGLYGSQSGQFKTCSGMLITLTIDAVHTLCIETYLRIVH